MGDGEIEYLWWRGLRGVGTVGDVGMEYGWWGNGVWVVGE